MKSASAGPGVDYINYLFEYQPMDPVDPRGPLNIYFCLWTPSLMLWTPGWELLA